MVQSVILVATPNPTDRSVVAADGDSAALARITAIPVAVSVTVVVVVGPHSHAANGGIDNSAQDSSSGVCEMSTFEVK